MELTIGDVIEHCNRQCERYEKFSKHIENCRDYLLENNKYYAEHYYVKEWLKELQRYKDLEEQGLLLKPPCKIGDTFFTIINGVIFELQLDEIWKSRKTIGAVTFCCTVADGGCGRRYIESDAKIYLSKAEAEKALAEMEK